MKFATAAVETHERMYTLISNRTARSDSKCAA